MIGDEGSNGVVWVGVGVGGGRESRRRRVAPRLNDQIVLLSALTPTPIGGLEISVECE